MATGQKIVGALANRMPKVIDPTLHAVIDYAVAGTFFAVGGLLWKRQNKHAALSSFICGGAVAATSLLTDYPGGVFRLISYRTHGRVDAGLSAMTATMPEFMGFEDEPWSRFFAAQGIAEAAVVGLTDFDTLEWRHSRRRAA